MGPRDAVRIIDADMGRSGTSTAGRSGFAELTTLVGLGQVGIVLALEVSRLARNNSDWYRPRTWPPTIRGYSTTRMPDVLVEPGALVPEQYLDVRVAGDPGPQRPLQRGLVDELLACERPHFNSS